MNQIGSLSWRKSITQGVSVILVLGILLGLPVCWFIDPSHFLIVWAIVVFMVVLTSCSITWYFSKQIERLISRIAAIGEIASAIDPVHPGVRIPEENLPEGLLAVVRGLNESWQRLEFAFEQQARFTADASHELRTPLAVIKSQVEQSLSRERSAQDYKETLTIVQFATQRLEDLFESLLMITRAESGTISAEFRTIDLGCCIKEVLSGLASEIESLKAEIKLIEPTEPVKIRGDLVLLERVFSNIMSNALKHGLDPTTPEGMKVEITVREEDNCGVVTVRDFGKGIPPNYRTRVFERFFKAERQPTQRKRKGCGLGLALAQSLAFLHKGKVSLEEVSGKGACFRVELPKWVSFSPKPALPTEGHRDTTPARTNPTAV